MEEKIYTEIMKEAPWPMKLEHVQAEIEIFQRYLSVLKVKEHLLKEKVKRG